MRFSLRNPRRVLPIGACALALVVTAVMIASNRAGIPSADETFAKASKVEADRPYLEWEVSQPLPEPTIAPQPRQETERGAQTPSVDEEELMLSLAAGPAAIAASNRKADAPSPTDLASNLSPGERAALLKPEVMRERPARRPTGPRFTIAIVEDNCEPPGRALP
jgi:hypothetical protein